MFTLILLIATYLFYCLLIKVLAEDCLILCDSACLSGNCFELSISVAWLAQASTHETSPGLLRGIWSSLSRGAGDAQLPVMGKSCTLLPWWTWISNTLEFYTFFLVEIMVECVSKFSMWEKHLMSGNCRMALLKKINVYFIAAQKYFNTRQSARILSKTGYSAFKKSTSTY